MRSRPYYSVRTGKNPYSTTFDLTILRRLFRDTYSSFDERGYFQEAFGYFCADNGDVAGSLGNDIEAQTLRRLRAENLWPIGDKCLEYSEDALFDVIEFLFDYISKPVEGHYHSYSDCSWHYHKFDAEAGRDEFRAELNLILADYKDGFELSNEGEVLLKASPSLEPLLTANLVSDSPHDIEARVQAATLKFRRQRASWDERHDAIRDLVDVLEYLRPQLKEVLTKQDEGDLFNIANNFGLLHHNKGQKTNYDKPIWYSWMFHYYLATIHAVVRLIEKNKKI